MLASLVLLCYIPTDYQKKSEIIVAEICQQNNIPGASLVVLQQGKPVVTFSYGIRKINSPERIEISDAMHVGSITKSFTGYLVGLAELEGYLKTTDTLSKHFPKIETNTQASKITISDLLHHTSGIKKMSDRKKIDFTNSQSDTDRRLAYVESVLTNPLDNEPNKTFRYDNDNYIVLGALLESIFQKTWEELVSSKIYKPLQMNSAGFGPTGKAENGKTQSVFQHQKIGEKLLPVVYDNPPFFGPAGTCHMSMPDLAKWTQLHMDGVLGNTNQFPKEFPNSAAFWNNLHAPIPTASYGFGWVPGTKQNENYSFGHSGSNTFSVATTIGLPKDGLVIAIAFNSAPTLDIADNTAKKILLLFKS